MWLEKWKTFFFKFARLRRKKKTYVVALSEKFYLWSFINFDKKFRWNLDNNGKNGFHIHVQQEKAVRMVNSYCCD